MADFIEKYGPWAIVTGANTGIGKAIATELAARGLNIVAVARRQALLDKLQHELGRDYGAEVRTISADLTDPESISKIELLTSDLEIGLVVPNAGTELSGPFIHSSLEANERILQLNVTAPMQMAKQVLCLGESFAAAPFSRGPVRFSDQARLQERMPRQHMPKYR